MADPVHVTHPGAQRFVDALAEVESSGDAAAMTGVFAAGAALHRMTHGGQEQVSTSSEAFWGAYRSAFGDISSTFSSVTEAADSVALEWTATGTTSGGHPVTYRGVSVLDLPDGDGPLTGFRTYYDSAAFTGVQT